MPPARIKVAFLSVLAACLASCSVAISAKTIYSIPFDYKKATPASIYFAGKTSTQIDKICKMGEHASIADMAACSQKKYESVGLQLNSTIYLLVNDYKKGGC